MKQAQPLDNGQEAGMKQAQSLDVKQKYVQLLDSEPAAVSENHNISEKIIDDKDASYCDSIESDGQDKRLRLGQEQDGPSEKALGSEGQSFSTKTYSISNSNPSHTECSGSQCRCDTNVAKEGSKGIDAKQYSQDTETKLNTAESQEIQIITSVPRKDTSSDEGMQTKPSLVKSDNTQQTQVNNCEHHSTSKSPGMQASTSAQLSTSKSEEALFQCSLLVTAIEGSKINIEMSWLDGTSKEAMHQVGQYIRNKFTSR